MLMEHECCLGLHRDGGKRARIPAKPFVINQENLVRRSSKELEISEPPGKEAGAQEHSRAQALQPARGAGPADCPGALHRSPPPPV